LDERPDGEPAWPRERPLKVEWAGEGDRPVELRIFRLGGYKRKQQQRPWATGKHPRCKSMIQSAWS